MSSPFTVAVGGWRRCLGPSQAPCSRHTPCSLGMGCIDSGSWWGAPRERLRRGAGQVAGRKLGKSLKADHVEFFLHRGANCPVNLSSTPGASGWARSDARALAFSLGFPGLPGLPKAVTTPSLGRCHRGAMCQETRQILVASG